VSKINIRSSKEEKRERCEKEENATKKKNNKSAKKKQKLAQLEQRLQINLLLLLALLRYSLYRHHRGITIVK
jgi:hypothetical protein